MAKFVTFVCGYLGCILLVLFVKPALAQQVPTGQSAMPTQELAPYMRELQVLTHKLSLSVAHANFELANFYVYESLEQLETIKEAVPEYRGIAVAYFIDRLMTPEYEKLRQMLDKNNEPGAAAAMKSLVDSCNQCHQTTKHGFIRILDRGDFNPFNQDFTP